MFTSFPVLTLRSSRPLTFSSSLVLRSKARSLPSSNLFLCFFPSFFVFFFLLASTDPPGVIIVAGRRLFFANFAGKAVDVDAEAPALFVLAAFRAEMEASCSEIADGADVSASLDEICPLSALPDIFACLFTV